MNENLANEIRKTIESVKDMKTQVGRINNYLSILEGLIRADYQKKVEDAYQRGYAACMSENDFDAPCTSCDAYQQGLNEAWEAARKVVLNPEDGGLDILELDKVFNCATIQQVFRRYTLSETIAKLKAYEEKQKADEDGKDRKGCQWEGNESDFYPCSKCCNSYKNRYERKEE